MLHRQWNNTNTIKIIKCINTKADKYLVSNMLTEGKEYEVKNETDEFYFIIDNSNKIGGYYKQYFERI